MGSLSTKFYKVVEMIRDARLDMHPHYQSAECPEYDQFAEWFMDEFGTVFEYEDCPTFEKINIVRGPHCATIARDFDEIDGAPCAVWRLMVSKGDHTSFYTESGSGELLPGTMYRR